MDRSARAHPLTTVLLMRIGILGTGNVGRALARGWSAAGHQVVMGSRRPGEVAAVEGAEVAGLRAAVEGSEVVVNATPGTASMAVLAEVGAAALEGKTVVDIGVGFTEEMALSHPVLSLGEEIQLAYPGARVVKTLATVDNAVMVDPGILERPGTVFLSGDDAEAKALTHRLLADLGWPEKSRMDLGGIGTAAGQEHFALLFIGIATALGSHVFSVEVIPARPTGPAAATAPAV
ncbi:NADPH-dependent F420 reductase [Streptomyces sp. NPDC051018]|uniref:NADPH-dependent F420 reductase n=1 Tax=Streptomyces sp. NPDC051018 TaxID=3365639 RepID=UPI0037B4E1FA